jgi:lysophospholipase L1-like esterase/ribosomal protein S28E/S33
LLDIKARRLLTITAILAVLSSSVFLDASKADGPLASDTLRIMPLGNSITSGYPGDEGYRKNLYFDLVNSGYNVNFVGSLSDGVGFDNNHEGHIGWHADQIRDNVYGWLVANPADVILLHIGTNDITDGQAPSSVVAEAQGILDNIDQWQTGYGEKVTVILSRIILTTNETLNAAVTMYNNALEAMVSTRITNGDRIIIVDMENALSYPSDLSDEFHPTQTGYAKMANVWYDALVSLWAERPLTIAIDPPTAGLVAADPIGPYHYFDVVTLTPSANAGYTFNSWSGDGTDGTQNTRIITITGNMTATATYTQNQYTLTLDHTGKGAITKTPNQTTYTYGTVVSLYAVADAGWSFGSWSGNLTGSSNPAETTIVGNITIMATFIQKEYTLVASAVGRGSVTRNPTGPYHLGDVVELTANPDADWIFTEWSGDLIGNINPATIIVDGSMSVTANFVQKEYTLTIIIAGNGSVTRSSSGPYRLGDVVTLTANPSAGWNFSSWSGALSGDVNPATITISNNEAVTATFAVSPLTVSVTPVSANLTIGETLTFNASVAGGYASYVYQWFLNGEAVAGAIGPSWDFKPNTTGSYSVYVQVVDSLGVKSLSNTVRATCESQWNSIADVEYIVGVALIVSLIISVLFVTTRRSSLGRGKGNSKGASNKKRAGLRVIIRLLIGCSAPSTLFKSVR